MKQITLNQKPPSVNRCYRHTIKGGKSVMYKTNSFSNFKEALGWKLKQAEDVNTARPTQEPLLIDLEFGFKSQHREKDSLEGLPYRDVDNPLKPLLDALEGLLFGDDTQIQKLTARKVQSDEPYIKICWERTDE